MIFKNSKEEKGITLLALAIIIIILLILAGVTITGLTGENGIIKSSKEAKKETEIANEKEILERATVQAMAEDVRGVVKQENLQNKLDGETDKEKTEVSDLGDEFEVLFKESNRYYLVDKAGNIGDAIQIIEDKSPGDITKDENGNNLDGSEDSPYEIWSIEDLVVFSNMVNGSGKMIRDNKVVNVEGANNFAGKYVNLKRSLNFKSKLSYEDSQRTDFGDLNGNNDDGNLLINEMTTGSGFISIGYFEIGATAKSFKGTFNGENNSIINLYNKPLFKSIQEAKIENIKVYGIEGIENSGGVIERIEGSNKVIINNVHNFVDIYVSTGGDRAGGIVNYINLSGDVEIINCSNHGNINGYSDYGAGGIIGYITAGGKLHIVNSYNVGNINTGAGISYSGAGGLVGLIYYSTSNIEINNCYNMGNISGKAVYKGNLIGNTGAEKTTIFNCYTVNNENLETVGAGTYTGTAKIMTLEEIKSQEFINVLNGNIMDVENWNRWYLNENGEPSCEINSETT